MSKSMVISLAATVIFAVVYITDCCVEAKEETPIITEIPHIEELNEKVVPTGDGRLVVLNSESEIEHGRVEIIEVKRKPTPRFIEIMATEIEEEATEETTEEEQPSMYFYGNMELTAYIATGNCCADGQYPQVGYTVACNNSDLWHKWIYIEGYGDRYVHDTGGMGYGVLDLFVGSYDEAINVGRRNVEVYVYE